MKKFIKDYFNINQIFIYTAIGVIVVQLTIIACQSI